MKLTKLSDILFPPRCVFCRKIIRTGDVCPECEKSLEYAGLLKRRGEFFSRAAAVFSYTGKVRSAVLKYKFSQKRHYAETFGRYMARLAESEFKDGFDIITWVPVSRKRLRKRGYDQSRLLAEKLAKRTGVVSAQLFFKVRESPPQSTVKGRAARNANVLGAFKAAEDDRIKGARVLLVDDILTTGATLSECARALLMQGAREVICLVFAAAGK